VEELTALYAGMDEACAAWGLQLVGGDTVAAQALALSVTVLGEVAPGRAVTRGGAQPGDALVVVGDLGAAAAALAQVAAGEEPDPALLAAHRRPRALVAAGRILAEHGATAMIDVSDGLGADLGHLCTASGVTATVHWEALPVADGVGAVAAQLGRDVVRLACGGGEDFALLAALPADVAGDAARAAGSAEGVPAAVIGVLAAPAAGVPAVQLILPDGTDRDLAGYGYDHYSGEG
jgi:thiamine-monophosphate kinase